jgi:hypothetical protein
LRPRRLTRCAIPDSHVADLLDQAVFHVEHVRLGHPEPIMEAS